MRICTGAVKIVSERLSVPGDARVACPSFLYHGEIDAEQMRDFRRVKKDNAAVRECGEGFAGCC